MWNIINNQGNQKEQLETYLIMKTGTKPQEYWNNYEIMEQNKVHYKSLKTKREQMTQDT